jgi:hypothetical protein
MAAAFCCLFTICLVLNVEEQEEEFMKSRYKTFHFLIPESTPNRSCDKSGTGRHKVNI